MDVTDLPAHCDPVIRLPDRRRFLAQLGAVATAIATPARAAEAIPPRTRLILLGTGGGPSPKPERSAPAQAIVVGDSVYLVDCGNGTPRQYVRAGLRFPALRALFITHQHSDHNADYGNLFLLGWTSGLAQPVDCYGPRPLKRMTRLFLRMQDYDIRTRIRDEGRPPLAPLIRPHEIPAPGPVYEDGLVRVMAALAHHPPVEPAFAYRFDTADRAIVISGDTGYSGRIVTLARGADVLVHEAMYLPAIDGLFGNDSNARSLRQHLLDSHTSTEDVGRVAAAAGVKTLVLSHLVPGADPGVTGEMWLEGVRRHFHGDVIVGSDLLEI